jgi:TetR/AcrR family transcriptional regulator, fatty acid metabolism regulator protein
MTTEISSRQFEIIEAAGRLLSASGVGGLTIKNLANEMKFSEAAIYRHFKSKDEIIIAMLNYLAESMEERFSAIPRSEDAVTRFKLIFQDQFRFFRKNPHFVVAVFSDGLMEENKRINDSIIRIMSVKMKHLKPIIAEGQQQGFFTREVSTEDLIHIVMGSFRLLMFKWRVAEFNSDIRRAGENMIVSVLQLITKK